MNMQSLSVLYLVLLCLFVLSLEFAKLFKNDGNNEIEGHEVLNTFINGDEGKIHSLIKEKEYDLVSNGVWDELIKIDHLPSVKHVLGNYYSSEAMRRDTFTKAIINGSVNIVKYMLEGIVKPESESEQGILVKLAFEMKQYKVLCILADCNYILPTNILHDAVILNDYNLVKSLLRFKDLEVDCVDNLGNTALHYASDPDIFKALMFKGDSFKKNFAGVNALFSCKPELRKRFDFFQFHFSSSLEDTSMFKTFGVNRKRVLEDSFYLVSREPEFYNLNFNFEIRFKGESGEDAGGLTREWFSLLIERFFVSNEDEAESNCFCGAAFELVDEVTVFYRVSHGGFTGPVEVYKFIGAVMAKSLLFKVPLRVKLVPSLVKLIFKKKLSFEDLKDDDPKMYNSILKGLEDGYNLSDVEMNEIAVNAMYARYKAQIDQFIEGFHSIFSYETIESFFTPSELQSVLAGAEVVNRSDLYNHIILKGDYWKTNSEIFWAGMDFLKESELFEFFRFITGINGLPYGGLSSLGKKFDIYDRSPDKMIRSSTCDYILMLPTSINSAEELVNVLRVAFASGLEFYD